MLPNVFIVFLTSPKVKLINPCNALSSLKNNIEKVLNLKL